jgi:putative ABC transport system permease protein
MSLAAGSPAPQATDPSRPPRLAERLLGASVPDHEWRDSILGDLREEYARTHRQRGNGFARRWYWAQAFSIGARGLAARWRSSRRRELNLSRSADIETGTAWHAGLSRDFRHAWRTLVRRPATSVVIVTTLALALATNATSFAILDAIVLRPYRFPDLDRIVMVASSDTHQGLFDRESVSPADFREWRREARTVTHLSASEWWDANLSGIDTPEQVAGFHVTADFFDALGQRPVIGRPFLPAEETPGNHRRVILGHALWSRLFNGDHAIVGRNLRIDGEPHEVVGVAPAGFAIPDGAQLWAPLAYTPDQWNDRRNRSLVTVARLADGATLQDARGELGALADRQRREYPDTNAKIPNAVVDFTTGMSDPGAAPFMVVMMAASGLLLLIACANIANLMLARGAERAPEFAVRLALGASRVRLAWQLLIEGALLAAMAIALAVPLAWIGLVLSRASIPAAVIRFVPGWAYLDISPVVFWSSAGFGLIASVLFALAPAIQTVRADVADHLRLGTRTTTPPRQRHWLRNSLAAAQVALTLALLVGSGLILSAADRAVNGAFGFDKRNLLIARLVLPERPYADADRRRRFIESVLERVRSIPAVTSASMVSNLPYGGNNTSREFWVDGVTLQPGEVRRADYRRATPEYFATMKIPLLAGRGFNDGDRVDTMPVAIISRSLGDRYFSDPNPIGRQFRVASDGPLITVVGVVGDVLHDWFQQRRAPTVYRPLSQDAPYAHAFVVRTIGNPVSIASDLRRAVNSVDPDQPIITLDSMENFVEERSSGLNYIAKALGVVALIALVLAVMGLYSLMTFMVARRTQELGVRMALGATKWQVIGLTSRQGVRITIAGLLVGGLAAVGIGRLLESVLFGVVSTSPVQLILLALLVAGVSLLASYVPARRTAKLDPTLALRSE